MNRLILTIAITAAGLATPAQAELAAGPSRSILWNQFNSITVDDSITIATTDFGLAALILNDSTHQFEIAENLLLGSPVCEAKLAGDVVVATGCFGILYFVDVSAFPQLQLLGEVDLGLDVFDIALYGEDIYLACGFDGLRKYALTNYSQLDFVDSSLAGIHCVQSDMYGSHLLVLDDYNGVLRYDLATTGISQLENVLWIPRRAASFSFKADTLFFPLYNQQFVYRGEFGPTDGHLTDSIGLLTSPELMLIHEDRLISVDTAAGLIELVPTSGGERILALIDESFAFVPSGDIYTDGANSHLVLTSGTFGLASYNLDELWIDDAPRVAYNRPGPVGGIAFHEGRLLTGGGENPTEFYAVDNAAPPTPTATLHGMRGATSVAAAGAYSVVYYREADLLKVLDISGDTIRSMSTTFTGSRNYSRIRHFDYDRVDSSSVLIGMHPRRFDLWELHANGNLVFTSTVNFLDEILDATIVDSFLYVATAQQQLYTYRLFANLYPTQWWTVSTPASLDHLTHTGPRLFYDGVSMMPGEFFGFAANDMFKIHIRNDGFPSVLAPTALPVDVTSSCVAANYLFTTGAYGMAVFDLSRSEVELADYGGFGGHTVAYGDSTIAVTDGSAVHLYSFIPATYLPGGVGSEPVAQAGSLRQNFPNPFNPRTHIDFELQQASAVDISIYDILGRKVTTLVSEQLPAGSHSVEWDGKGRDGRRVASGVYLYRMTTPAVSQTRKMVMLK